MEQNPYKAPVSKTGATTVHTIRGPYGLFRDNRPLRTLIVLALSIKAVLFAFVFVVLHFVVPAYDNMDLAQLNAIIKYVKIGQIIAILTFLIAFCFWLNRSCKNGWLLDAPKMRTTPGLAVGYYFIPVLALWKPYTTMREISRASYGRDDALKICLSIWWALWLAFWSLGLTGAMIGLAARSQEAVAVGQKLQFVASPINLLLDVIAIYLVTSITAAQHRRASQWQH